MNQKEAYYMAITSVIKESGINFEESSTVCLPVFTKEMRKQVVAIVCEGFRNKTIGLKDTPANAEKLANPAKLQDYAYSTLTNWLNKDTRFNGGVKHEIKNKGSRAGQGDKNLKNLKLLRDSGKFEVGSDQYKMIETKITERIAVITAEKRKKTEVDLTQIDPALLEELGLS